MHKLVEVSLSVELAGDVGCIILGTMSALYVVQHRIKW
jgi:hypothetical protein